MKVSWGEFRNVLITTLEWGLSLHSLGSAYALHGCETLCCTGSLSKQQGIMLMISNHIHHSHLWIFYQNTNTSASPSEIVVLKLTPVSSPHEAFLDPSIPCHWKYNSWDQKSFCPVQFSILSVQYPKEFLNK